jgi:hypothetical protein
VRASRAAGSGTAGSAACRPGYPLSTPHGTLVAGQAGPSQRLPLRGTLPLTAVPPDRDRHEGGTRPESGGLDLTGKAAVLKTAGRKPIGVRIPGPPLGLTDSTASYPAVGTKSGDKPKPSDPSNGFEGSSWGVAVAGGPTAWRPTAGAGGPPPPGSWLVVQAVSRGCSAGRAPGFDPAGGKFEQTVAGHEPAPALDGGRVDRVVRGQVVGEDLEIGRPWAPAWRPTMPGCRGGRATRPRHASTGPRPPGAGPRPGPDGT